MNDNFSDYFYQELLIIYVMMTAIKLKSKAIFLSMAIITFSIVCNAQVDSIDYLGQTPPSNVPQIFAPGIVSVANRYEYGLSVSPDGKEIFFTCEDPGDGLMKVVKDSNTWNSPKLANLRNINSWEFEAFYTQAGDSLFFTSKEDNKQQLYFLTKTETRWGDAKKLISAVNDDDVMWCSFSANGNMYYTKTSDLNSYCSKKVDGVYQAGVKVADGAHPYVSSDESYFLYNGANGGIYIKFRDNDEKSWGSPIKLNNSINTSYGETCPSLSPDEKYMFFCRYSNKSDIYWVSTEFIKELNKPTNSVIQSIEQNIQVYPNPTKGKLDINFGKLNTKNAVVEICNIAGSVVLSNTFQNITTATIDLTGNPKGIYLVNISIDGQKLSKKICIE